MKLRSVFPQYVAFNRGQEVVQCQELRFARVASRHMKVGAYWYGNTDTVADPMLVKPFGLLDAGLPFLKKSLLGKMGKFQRREAVLEVLRRFAHPVLESTEL